MKKRIILLTAMMACPALAMEITSPFYQPQAGHILSKTGAFYTKNKMKDRPSVRIYRRDLNEEITLGLGAGLAALMEGDLNWTRQKQIFTQKHPQTKGYAAGLKGQWQFDDVLTQFSALYRQTTNVIMEPRREIEAHVRLGKQLKTMTPYVHLSATFPLNARSDTNGNIYRGETGVFQTVNTSMTLDSAIYLQYDKNMQERSYGIRAEWSYLINPQIAWSLNGEWQARGHAKGNTRTYHQAIGTKITFTF